MLRVGNLENRLELRTFNNEKFHGTTEYLLESQPEDAVAPQAFLASQEANWALPTHFHKQEQFQVITSGDGMLGRHKLERFCVHYASRESAYGPIVAGPAGLQYLTLRAVSDTGAWYIPEARSAMRTGLAKRQQHAGPVAILQNSDLVRLSAPAIDTVIEPDAFGLAAWLVSLGPGQSAKEPTHPGGAGRFLVIANGELNLEQHALRGTACAFASQEEQALTLQSGTEGAQVLVLQFPLSATGVQHSAD